MKKALIALVALVVVLVGLDRIAVVVVTGVAADAMKSGLDLDATPGLDIEGFPFLTQWASSDFDHVHVQFHNFTETAGGNRPQVTYQLIDANLYGVRPQNGFHTLMVDHISGEAVIAYPQAVEVLDAAAGVALPLRFAPGADDHTLKVTAAVFTFPVGVSLDQNQPNTVLLTFHPSNGLAAQYLNTIPGMHNDVFSLPLGLPFGLVITSVTLQADGIHGTVSGSNVQLSRGAVQTTSSGTAA